MDKGRPKEKVRRVKALLVTVIFKYIIKIPKHFTVRFRLSDYFVNMQWNRNEEPKSSEHGDGYKPAGAETGTEAPAATPSTDSNEDPLAAEPTDEELAQYVPHFIIPPPTRLLEAWSQAVKRAYQVRYKLYKKGTLASKADRTDLVRLRNGFVVGAALWGSNGWMALTLGVATLLAATVIVLVLSVLSAEQAFDIVLASPVIKVAAAVCTAYVAIVTLIASLLIVYAIPALFLRFPLVQGSIVSAVLYLGLTLGGTSHVAATPIAFVCYAIIIFRLRLTAFVRVSGFVLSLVPLVATAFLQITPIAVVAAAQMLVVLQLMILGAWYVGTLLWRVRERLYRRNYPISLLTDALAFAVFIYENANHLSADVSQSAAQRRVLQNLRTVASLMRSIGASLSVNNAAIDNEVARMFAQCAATIRKTALSVALPDEQSRSKTLNNLFDFLLAACRENWGRFETHPSLPNPGRSARAAQVLKTLRRLAAILILAAAIYGLHFVHAAWLTDTLRSYILSVLIAYDVGLCLALFDPDLADASTRILTALGDKGGQ